MIIASSHNRGRSGCALPLDVLRQERMTPKSEVGDRRRAMAASAVQRRAATTEWRHMLGR
jgi:hypothetical protein